VKFNRTYNLILKLDMKKIKLISFQSISSYHKTFLFAVSIKQLKRNGELFV